MANYRSNMHSLLSRCCTARGSSTRFSLVSPSKLYGSLVFSIHCKFPCIENKEHMLDFLITFKSCFKNIFCIFLLPFRQKRWKKSENIKKIIQPTFQCGQHPKAGQNTGQVQAMFSLHTHQMLTSPWRNSKHSGT